VCMGQRPELNQCLILTTVAKQFEKATFLPQSRTPGGGATVVNRPARSPPGYQEPCGNNDIAASVYSST
jgi:hypothetical protein